MIYVTGDIHGEIDISKLNTQNFSQAKAGDYLIVCGDFGLIWDMKPSRAEEYWMKWLSEKPFSLPVLKARIDALLSKQDIFAYKNVCVNFKSYTAKIDGKTMDINAKELEILKYLLDNAGIALTRAQILDHVWKDSEEVPYDRVIDVYIKELRKKLGLDCITTIRNVGYKLEKS